jgi:hypothetical protein
VTANHQKPAKFIVEVRYREPSYELQHGARAEPYRFRYRVHAQSEQAAIEFAISEFERVSALSWVGWTRSIVEIVVESVLEPQSPPG